MPDGDDETANVVLKTWGEPTRFDFPPQAHWDLGPALGILDFERAAKITGARFTVLKGPASLLSRALIQFLLDLHTREHGYTEVLPPFLVNSASLFGTGQLPKFEEDLFRLAGDGLVPDAHGRGAGHEPPPRRGPPGGRAAHFLLRVHAVLPRRGGSRGTRTRAA